MQLRQPIQNVFVQLTGSLDQLTNDEYARPIRILSDATIGQHVRHIIELFLCLDNGYQTGKVNYDRRKRDRRIETDKDFAIDLLKDIYHHRLEKPNIEMLMESESFEDGPSTMLIPTTYYREVAYNLEHTIHHMALIRVGINEVSTMTLPQHFGVANSTIKYREQCAQ